MMRSYKKSYLEVKKEKELLEEEVANLKESQKKLTEFKSDTVFNNSIDKVQDGLDKLYKYLSNSNIIRIEVNARMRTSDADECFVGIVYEVVLYVIDDKNKKTEVFSLPVFAGADGCMISKRACKRRMDYFELTRSIAQFIKNRVNWEYVREKRGLDIIITEDMKEGMFKYQSEMTIRINKESLEEFRAYAEMRGFSVSDLTKSADEKTVLFEVLIEKSYIDEVQQLPYVVNIQETRYYSPS
ncbi:MULTISPECIES: hypothetical protein [unclassified Bacillus (in: firmicutes)]|uniref:hypothetical protein n=1 Tax=unclassified Bacillus (in: firmicutes) TaxID=185979 RepID=UPI0030103987